MENKVVRLDDGMGLVLEGGGMRGVLLRLAEIQVMRYPF